REWGKDAVLATPEYFHNAVFYSPEFRFLSPREQGRFLALRRDLGSLSVAQASAAILDGRVRDLGASRTLTWQPGVIVSAVSEALARALESEGYSRACQASLAEARFASDDAV
ncbi:MAG TPA: hypothetical protein VMV21_04680, partial [Vicinamibacteria bacterium]|nr:hypothetical protein [Vicinamibacteria bacterium]